MDSELIAICWFVFYAVGCYVMTREAERIIEVKAVSRVDLSWQALCLTIYVLLFAVVWPLVIDDHYSD